MTNILGIETGDFGHQDVGPEPVGPPQASPAPLPAAAPVAQNSAPAEAPGGSSGGASTPIGFGSHVAELIEMAHLPVPAPLADPGGFSAPMKQNRGAAGLATAGEKAGALVPRGISAPRNPAGWMGQAAQQRMAQAGFSGPSPLNATSTAHVMRTWGQAPAPASVRPSVQQGGDS